jgi:glycosyltransferase involved in cell wall biosynthesis
MKLLSVLIPAHNEAAEITDCLGSVFASDPLPEGWQAEVLVLANGCSDDTAELARGCQAPAGWQLSVLEQTEGGKLKALNAGDAAAGGQVLAYLDADVRISPGLLAQTVDALGGDAPRHASGTLRLMRARSALTRAYGRFWSGMPFLQDGVPGFGYFAMNRTGRSRWQDWPDIIADDMFARLQFTPEERVKLPAAYDWPLVEGAASLIRVRRRQDAGNQELAARYPELLQNDDKLPPRRSALLRQALRDPFGCAAYALVKLGVKTPLFAARTTWDRGR